MTGDDQAARAVRAFYDDLAPTYDLLFPDWAASTQRQGAALARILDSAGVPPGTTVLDCASGIGTQALGLAALGYSLVGCDVSGAAVRRLADESRRADAPVACAVADMRRLPLDEASVDAVVCADNSLPHLLDARDVEMALSSMLTVTRPGGPLVVSVRDYDTLRAERPIITPPSLADGPAGRVVTFQLWTWHADGEHYDLEHVQVFEGRPDWSVRRRVATYWALTREQLEGCLARSGWHDVAWHEPQASGFFQPVVVARRPGPA